MKKPQLIDSVSNKSLHNPYESLKNALARRGFSIGRACVELEITSVGLKKGIEKGSLKVETLKKLATLLEVSLQDVLAGNYYIDNPAPKKQDTIKLTDPVPDLQHIPNAPDPLRLPDRTIPVYDIQLSSSVLKMFDEILSGTPVSQIQVPAFKGAKSAITMLGEYMRGKYNPGDILPIRIIDDYDDLHYGQIYLVGTKQNTVVARVYEGSKPESLLLVFDNKEKDDAGRRKFPDYEIKREKIIGMAAILGIIAQDRA